MRCTTFQRLKQGGACSSCTSLQHFHTKPAFRRSHYLPGHHSLATRCNQPCPATPRRNPAISNISTWQVHGHGVRRMRMKSRAATTTTAPSDLMVTEPAAASASPFSWTKQWWPLIPLDYLDPQKPKAMTVMGVQVVVWRDGEGQWRCFKDACPHRLAPLSEGRVESDGTLLCAYHAWRFDGEGKCTTIPQATSKEAEDTAKKSRRSCATAFPVQEKVGLLWVWPDESETRWLEAAAAQPTVTRIQEQRYASAGNLTWFMRDVPYSYEVLVENLIDPAHVPVSHHKLHPLFDTRYKLCRMEFGTNEDPESPPWLMADTPPTVTYEFTSGMTLQRYAGARNILQFTAPSLIAYGDKKGAGVSTQLFAIPVGPSRSRVIHCDINQPLPAPPPANMFEGFKQALIFRLFISPFLKPENKHRSMLKLFDGDGVFLNLQETNLHREHNGDWRRAYYMPATCDRGVAAALGWVDQVGRPFPLTTEAVQGPIDRRVLLDRHSQHTAHCPICQKEVKRLEGLLQAAKALAAACFLAACGVLGSVGWAGLAQAAPPFLTLPGAAVAALLAVAVWAVTGWTRKLEAHRQEYFFTDYVHADID